MSPQAFSDLIWRWSPEYQLAYEEGYNAAKREMHALIRAMTALHTVTTTVGTEELTAKQQHEA